MIGRDLTCLYVADGESIPDFEDRFMAVKKTKPKVKRASSVGTSTKSATKAKPLARKATVGKSDAASQRAAGKEASRLIDERIRTLGDWRGETLARMRALILEADPDMTEEWKWMGTPVWSHGGNICTGETYKQVVKLTFAKGAALDDPKKLFNSSLEGNTRRAIDIREGEVLHAGAFKSLILAAVAENLGSRLAKPNPRTKPTTASKGKKSPAVLLSGGNPQIAKGEGDGPVQEYIAAMPGWKKELGKRLDALVVKQVPKVRKAVKWNSPFYGVEGQGWFLSFHVFTHYVKVTFFNGASLQPLPPGGTERSKDARWIDIRETDALDEKQLAKWIKQAAALPGWLA